MVEKRDPFTAGHQRRVADLAVAIADELQLDAVRKEGIRFGAMIHDIGNIYVPAEILNRPGALSESELKIVQSHPSVGYDIVKDIDFPWPVADMILHHQERLDGSGYPDGLRGEAISLEARIIGVADVVEAMLSHRPYRSSFSVDQVLEEIANQRGVKYDEQVVDACLRLFREKGYMLPV
jgi:putative nucleotidyltransferase with HDIG domain